MSFVSGVLVGLLLVAAALWLRRRYGGGHGGGLSDADIRAIEERGLVALEDPLDLEQIRDEERRFWEETWDEPEEM